ncbi:MAG: DUF4143 domain-containing protein [Propionibacteriaceae bacterium]|nr:DUF4143 domain-containing protein [Propionibacteriaceae bacterium]
MTERTYQPRVLDEQLRQALRAAGAVVIEGSKACGKTTTAEQVAASSARLDRNSRLRTAGIADPSVLLEGEVPRLIDEWQVVSGVWNAVRAAVDDRGEPGQFILTGSATPADDETRHSGAMRFIRIQMRPMSLFESGLSTGVVSLAALWNGAPVPPSSHCATLMEVAQAACRGGWPALRNLDVDSAQDLNRSYLRSIASGDIVTVDGIRRDPNKVSALLNALGRNTATYVSNRRLQTDSAAFGSVIDPSTITDYLDALQRLWVLAPQYAWGGHLRSSAPARKAPKRHLVDPSLAAAAMDATPDDLLMDHEAYGQVFETLVFRDLSVYTQADGFDVRAFQDSKNNEIDAVIVKGASWAGIEVKLTAIAPVVESAATKLTTIAARMTTQPKFLALITADGPTYTRRDGVHVISVAHLGP